MTDEYLYLTGRIVQGDVFTPQTKNMTGGPLVNLRGEPKVQYFIGVAVAKTDPGLAALQQQLQQIAVAGFPNGETSLPTFAWKMLDGDLAPHNAKAGFPGHVIFRFSSGFPVHVCTQGGAAQITDPEAVKRGYYVRVVFQAKANGNAAKPGLYMNHKLVELVGYGEIIQSGPDAAALLGNAGAAALPAGASATPVATGAPAAVPGAAAPGAAAGAPATAAPIPGAAVPGAAPIPGMVPGAAAPIPGAPAAAAPIPGATPPAAAPVAGYPGAPAPAPAATPPVPGAPPATDFLTPPVLTAKANGVSYQQFIDQGWTDDTLQAHGYLEDTVAF